MRNKQEMPRSFVLGLIVAAGLPVNSVLAQEAKPAATPGQLETIIVTSERRSENIKDVPNSVSAIRGEELEVLNSAGQDVRQLAARVPSLNIESSFGRAFPRFYIRGLGNTDFDLNASQPVSLVLDDVVQENPILKGFPIFDVEQVEVLRGPQGTLFGRNSPAGVVKFDSVKPRKNFEAYVNAAVGTYDTRNLEWAINSPRVSDWAVRFSAQTQQRGDWVENTFRPGEKLEGYKDNAWRFQALYDPSANLSALFNVHARSLDGTARLFRANIIKRGTNDLVDGFDPDKISIDGGNSQKVDSNGFSAKLRWVVGDVAFHSITAIEKVTAYSRGDIDGGYGAAFLPTGGGPGFIPFTAESADGLRGHKQVTEEFRIESNDNSRLKWLTGLYYFNEDLTIESFDYATLAGGSLDGYATQQQKNKAYAAFGSVGYNFTDAFNLRGGIRYTHDEKDFTAQRFQSPIGAGQTPVLVAAPRADDVSWDLSATYAVDKDINIYGRVAKGFRAPSIQGRLLFGDSISVAQSEKVLSYEIGFKADLWNKRARLHANLFQYDVKDQQLTAVGGGANFNRLLNADKTRGSGAEVDFQTFITDNVRISVGASYNKTEIRDAGLAVDACGNGCTITNRVIAPADPANFKFAPTVSINGNPLPQAPKMVGNFTFRYGTPITATSEFFIFSDWAYRSKINLFLYEAVEYTGKPLLEGGLRVGYKWDNDKYEVSAYGRNITNQIRAVGGIDFNNLTGFINDPRFVGVQFKGNF